MRAKDLTPGVMPGKWTLEELRPQLLPNTWEDFLNFFGTYLRKQPDFRFSVFEMDVFFTIFGDEGQP